MVAECAPIRMPARGTIAVCAAVRLDLGDAQLRPKGDQALALLSKALIYLVARQEVATRALRRRLLRSLELGRFREGPCRSTCAGVRRLDGLGSRHPAAFVQKGLAVVVVDHGLRAEHLGEAAAGALAA